MLRTNKEVVAAYKRFSKNVRGEIAKKLMVKLRLSTSGFTKRIQAENFSLKERIKIDEVLEPYFQINPEVLQEL